MNTFTDGAELAPLVGSAVNLGIYWQDNEDVPSEMVGQVITAASGVLQGHKTTFYYKDDGSLYYKETLIWLHFVEEPFRVSADQCFELTV